MSDRELRGRTPRGAFWATVEVWGVELLQFIVFTVLARLLGPTAYGLLGLAMMPVLVANVFILPGGWIEFIVQRRDLDDLHVDSVFWLVLGVGAAFGLTLVLLAPTLATQFGDPRLRSFGTALAACPPLMALSVLPAALLQREINLAPLAMRSTLAVTIAGAVGIGMAMAGYGPWSLVTYEILSPLVAATVLWHAIGWRPKARFSAVRIKEAARFALRISGERLINLTETLLPRAMLGKSFGAAEVGQWALARKIFDLSAELVQRPALRVAMPRFSAVQNDRIELSHMLCAAAELTGLVAIPGYAMLAVLGSDLVSLLFGESWRDAGEALMFLAMLGFITPLTQLTVALLYATGRVAWTLSLSAGGFLLLLAMLPAAIRYGVTGLAAAFLVRGWMVLVLRLWVIHRTEGINLGRLGRTLVPPVLAGAAMTVALWSARTAFSSTLDPRLLTPVVVLLGLLCYVVVLLIVARRRVSYALGLARQALRPRGQSKPVTRPRSDVDLQ